jgi:diaminopimelate epimerase
VPIEVVLPGGPLRISIDRETRAATMRGPARLVFRGEVVAA